MHCVFRGMSVLIIYIAVVIMHIEGACIGTMCVNFTEIENRIDSGLQVAGSEISRAGQTVEEGAEEAFETVKKEGMKLTQEVEDYFRQDSGQCECLSYNCGCCAHLVEPAIELNSTICANASYLAQDYGISLTVTVNKYAIFNETVSVKNPPPVCLGVPYVKEWAEACVRLHDIDATRSHLHACVRVEARMKRIVIAKYELGCFDLGPHVTNDQINDLDSYQYPSVLMV